MYMLKFVPDTVIFQVFWYLRAAALSHSDVVSPQGKFLLSSFGQCPQLTPCVLRSKPGTKWRDISGIVLF